MTTSLLKQPVAYMTADGPGVMSNYMGFSSAPLLGHPPYRGRHGEPMSPFFVPAASSTYTIPHDFYQTTHYGTNIPFSDSKPVVPEQQEIAVNALLALNSKSAGGDNHSPTRSGTCTPTTMSNTAFSEDSPPDLISALRMSSGAYTPGEAITGFEVPRTTSLCLHESPYAADVKPIIPTYGCNGGSPVGTPITSPVSTQCDRSPGLKPRVKSMHKTGNNICQICGKSYARPSTLKTHMRTHSGEKPYKCEVCSKAFTQAANLTAHLRTHSGEKPFSCPICQKRFSQSSSVTTHLRTHSGERPYRCDYCGKAFADTSTLTKHKRIHSGEKPYRCKICNLGFSQSGNLHRHMKTHNN